ncbi:FAD-dependent oxidoreductase [Halosimplex halophilum]|uniref:FAD-dependent oxidoreductase n=1 Tax=Halosimplex halophilum TaxID=2559572 RepID=UPI00107F3815|nr:FAD-dependent oxidoreductase [Halosimplex halophilum]
MSERFVVVGGDAAGLSAAAKARRADPDREVVVLERGAWVSFGACGIPYYVKGEIPELEDLLVTSPEKLVGKYGIDLRRHHEVTAVDPEAGRVTVDGGGERYELAYDDLLLATGGHGATPDAPGGDLDGVFTVRSLDEGRALREYLTPGAGTRPGVPTPPTDRFHEHLGEVEAVAVVGANKIGLELVEAFDARGLAVHVVDDGAHVFERGPLTLPPFGPAAAGIVEERLRERGVELHLDSRVERFVGADGAVTAVETGDERIPVDAVLVDEGVEPNAELAAGAGIELGATGAIATDAYGRTSAPDVYAAGDCAEKHHHLLDEPVHLPLGLAANRGGRAVGATVAGTPTRVGPVVGTVVMKVFDLEVACSGVLDAETAREAGFDPVTETVTTISRAHYYPGGSRIVVEMAAGADDGRLLGAGLVGEEGCAHRVNAVATALHTDLTVGELADLDFGYSPPFGPVWDPVLTAAKAVDGDLG